MNRATPQILNLAMRLMAHEISLNQSSATGKPLAFLVCERLHPYLALVTGNAGYRALLVRALELSKPQVPWLRAMQVAPDGALMKLAELETQGDPDELAEGGVILISQLLGLLVAFIGEKLTLRMVREVWPELPLGDFDFDFARG